MTRNDVLLDAIIQRKSVHAKMLTEPGPSEEDLNLILQAAMAAPDHKSLSPWRFIVIEGEGLKKFGELMAAAHKEREPDTSEKKLAKSAKKALRAPMIIAIALHEREHRKVPKVEQILSAGCAMQQMLLAAEALGYGAAVLSGLNMFGKPVHEGLGLKENEEMLGLFYIGTPKNERPNKPRPKAADFTRRWPE